MLLNFLFSFQLLGSFPGKFVSLPHGIGYGLAFNYYGHIFRVVQERDFVVVNINFCFWIKTFFGDYRCLEQFFLDATL